MAIVFQDSRIFNNHTVVKSNGDPNVQFVNSDIFDNVIVFDDVSDAGIMEKLGFTRESDPRLIAKFLSEYPSIPHDNKASYVSEFLKRVGKFTLNSTSLMSNFFTISTNRDVQDFIAKWLS